jgi:general secretion pathway protein N
MSRRYAVSAVIATATVATAGVIGWQTDWGRAFGDQDPDVAARRGTLDTTVLPAHKLAPLDSEYKQIAERPLFVPTRRPAPPANSAPQVVMKKGQFKLAGTTVGKDISVAYLVETASNKTHRVNMGNEINGIRVERVDASRVVLKQGEDTEELVLRTSQSPKLPPPPQVAAVPGQAVPAGGLPGVPGGNFGPPLQPGQVPPGQIMPGQMVQGQFPAGQSSGGPQMPVPGVTAGGTPLPNPNQNPNANNPAATQAPDPNAVQMRRRRFQNLPQ